MAEGFAAFTQFSIDDGTLRDTLLKMAQLACDVSQADMAGITMLVDGRPRTGVFTDPEAADIDTAQYDTGHGPHPEPVLPPVPFDGAAEERVMARARQAAIVLVNAQLYWDSRLLSENMQQAMRSRSAIDQAIGILLADGGRTLRRLSSCWSGPYSARTARSATSPPASRPGRRARPASELAA